MRINAKLAALVCCLNVVLAVTVLATGNAANVPKPADVVGFSPGEDKKLASWSKIVEYFQRLDRASDRLQVEELGKTTLGRPFVLATISSPANLARLDRYREIQRRLADPRIFNSNDVEAEKLIAEGRTIVAITCGIHSTEVGSNLVSMIIAHRLASDDSEETRRILDNCIILLVPSLNPDGIDIVKAWYDKTLGTPAEGSTPPELYHHYVGHDNNRDWYAFTQVETQLTVDKVHNAWHPQIVHDIHQQGDRGSRFFVPPYAEPWEPNVPAIIQSGVNFMGSAMAWELIAEGKAGVVINGVYDAWTPARAYQHYHGGIRILSETASGRLASPTEIPFESLNPQIGVNPKIRSWNFPVVWQGGRWRLSDIMAYMESGAFALLRNSALYRDRWIRDFYRVGKDAVRERKPGEPFAFLLLPRSSKSESTEAGAVRNFGLSSIEDILKRGEVETVRAAADFEAGGKRYPAGTLVVPLTQPYGAFAKTLLENQRYPDLREYPGGPPRRPYDVVAHTLPLLMGVETVQVDSPFAIPAADKSRSTPSLAQLVRWSPAPRVALYRSYNASMDEGWTRWIFDRFKIKSSPLLDAEVKSGGLSSKYDCIIIPSQTTASIVEGLSATRYPAQVAGGIGPQGIESLKKFVEDGGTLITLNNASGFAIEKLGAPVTNVLEGVSNGDFYCPGSILKIDYDSSDPLARGVPNNAGWFEQGLAFETQDAGARIIARYGTGNPLLSGWLLGGDRIAGKGAIVEARAGRGRLILFGFRPQYRGQSLATLPFLFNAIRTSVNNR